MAMTYLILANAERAKQGDPAPLTIIEEPENGLFVGHLKPLFQRIDPQGGGGQFIFTTHSPYFIDLFDDHLDGVHVLRPGKPSSVLVRPDPAKVRALLDQMPLGEMHFREMLG
jgi:predicted ATPase